MGSKPLACFYISPICPILRMSGFKIGGNKIITGHPGPKIWLTIPITVSAMRDQFFHIFEI